MSGHSGFMSIDSGGIPNMSANPQTNGNIGVGGVHREGQQNVQTNARQEQSSALIRQLDILLMRMANVI